MAVGMAVLLCLPTSSAASGAEAASVPSQAVQQGQTVKGNVVDETGQPMIGVTVKVKGGRAATVTDLDGNFSIQAGPNDQLELSYVGYQTATVSAGSAQHITMKPENTDLDEVVVIGFGTVKKRDLTGSVASIRSDAILQTPTSDVATAMQGRISGVDINGSTIRIRGNRSINGSNDPLVIIDGVQGGSMSDLNPNDIESIDVLKDASSTAIYGSQGANGVIIITTKKAEVGRLMVSYDGYVTAAFRGDKADYRSPQDFYNTRRLAAQNAGLWNSEADDEALFDNLESYAAFRANSWTDYEKLLQRNITWSTKHTLTLSGGTEKTSARFSLGYANDGSKWKKGSGNDKFTLRANIDHKMHKWINAGVNFQLTHTRFSSSPYEKATTTGLELGSPYGMYDPDTDTYVIGDKLVERPLAAGDYVNPLIDAEYDDLYKSESYSTNVVANAYLDFHPIEGLNFRSQVNTHLTNSSSGSYTDAKSAASLESTGKKNVATMSKSSGTYIEWNNILTYNFTMLPEDHHLGVTLLTSWNKTLKDELSATSYGQTLASNLWWNIGSNDGQDGSSLHSSSYTQAQNFSYAARVSYDWKSRYLLTASIRRDGSSKLAEGNKWDWFPSAALAWRVSDEPFMKNTKSWLDDLKIRATYGVTGNAGIGVYGTQSGVTFANWSFGFQDTAANRYLLGVVDNNGSDYYVIANKDTKWEKSTTFDLGFDAVLFNSRLNITFDWYTTKTTDLILLRSLPTSAGQDGKYATYTNIGSTKNTGVEFTINSRNIVTKDFTWTTTLTGTWGKEKIESLPDGDLISENLFIGHPIHSIYDYKYAGIWSSNTPQEVLDAYGVKPGWVKVETNDKDGDGGVHPYGDDDKKILGHENPNWILGLNNTFTYKGFDLTVYIMGRFGQTIYSDLLGQYTAKSSVTQNQISGIDYWTEDNQGAYYPRPGSGDDQSNGTTALRIYDGSFIKIKNITLGYTLPQSITRHALIQKCRFYFTAYNPWIFCMESKLDGTDPEMGGSDTFPTYKQFVFGVNLTF